ncbi:hypothetical protein H2198_002582 [Neophaeococcomyces mojaviensis]|uniref:Uncharacterized protein n=1 Tax=Neophaeococcomyces mojaviensis TaxID=3383035 RepID=A0ACC3ADY2_9EURO|nr:hypothetical protein H2198_002582 [Knufia sp. JES_112]
MILDETTITSSAAPTSTRKHLKAKQLLSHPAFGSNEWHLPPTKSGHASINGTSQRPGGPFKIFYEIHGTGPIRLLLIMGLGAYRTAWKRQTKYFGHAPERASKYSVLVFDNRGVAKSDKPTCRYSTREMALDTVELLGHVGWLEESVVQATLAKAYGKAAGEAAEAGVKPMRDLNVAGVSMGGMIAQEVGLLLAPRIQSLFLVSTAPRIVRTVPFIENLRQRINMFIPRDIDVQLEEIAYRLFSKEFLETEDRENEDPKMNFPTTRDRFAASELAKRQDKEGFTRKGFVLQAIAAGWHHKSKAQLQEMVREIGAERICVMHGSIDQMITFRHFALFKEDMGEDSGVTFKEWDGAGHVLMWEKETAFNEAMQDFLEKMQKIDG